MQVIFFCYGSSNYSMYVYGIEAFAIMMTVNTRLCFHEVPGLEHRKRVNTRPS